MWFVCFCYLTDAWRKTDEELSNKAGVHRIQTAIAFSFFSIITWVIFKDNYLLNKKIQNQFIKL